MKKQELISGATIIVTGLAGQSALAGSIGADELILVAEERAEPDLIAFAPSDTGIVADPLPLIEVEQHDGTWAGGVGDDMVRIPDTELREVTGPQGRKFMVQVNRQTREVFNLAGEPVDPPRWLIEQLRAGQ